jgi:hypothetical protein
MVNLSLSINLLLFLLNSEFLSVNRKWLIPNETLTINHSPLEVNLSLSINLLLFLLNSEFLSVNRK